MLHELGLGGMLFSPLVVMIPAAFGLMLATRLAFHRMNWRRFLWKPAWFDVGVFVCYLALVVYLFGNQG